MIFGKIDYINLLPLHIYLKKYPLPNGYKASMEYKKGVPSKLNKDLFYKRIDAAIISSIESARKKYKNLDLGICANKRVFSVLVEKNTLTSQDPSSATSNALAKILKQEGRVIIGDKALKLYLKYPLNYVDLCAKWHEKTALPFVFARFSCAQKKILYEKMFKNFLKIKIKIPHYILQNYAKTRNLNIKDIKYYLDEVIYYKISTKEKLALKRFIKACKALNLV
ncbi:menaquinone via futalosine step 1 [Campylobacter sp. VicNov18]|uniref:MqnA/MqnD/SBP family protein n=1 Tax=Campylobacter bilis TaxID=2691918 RepID=UPI00130D8FA5|nr:MqnA/MqnD/SBP family protein [Campylobacter bilis]MPV63100.1 menaquinone via futalosine step 1 [Campylobacter hepaticus]MBM0636599.1 menaquinone via futalosine step 1 [Campylobacter bilis]MCC8277444.1 menaquinone via futalosine step 1 [Campylobacter bilis]MCC8298649.1 menaquinone via futalosine step 1 [Campylobacter bilis]MCC8300353.1 menaquinone via futalosine step 1 [Campylobacter bilis]